MKCQADTPALLLWALSPWRDAVVVQGVRATAAVVRAQLAHVTSLRV